MEYAPRTNTISYHDKWSQKIRGLIGTDEMLFQRQGYVKKDNFLYMIVSRTNIIVKLDMDTMESSVYRIPYGFRGVNLCYDGEFFWIVPMDGKYIVRWNESTDLYQRISLPKITEQFAFLGGDVVKDSVVLFPSMADYVLRIDRKSLNVTIDEILTQYISDIHTNKYVLLNHETGRIFACLKNRTIQEFDSETGKMTVHNFDVDYTIERDIRMISQYGKEKNIVSYEAEDMNIELWIDIFLQNTSCAEFVEERVFTGEKIYQESIV